MNSFIPMLNVTAGRWLNFAGPMLIQSSILIILLFVFDVALRRKLRPAVRYALWLIVLVKLVVPPSFALPTSAAWWIRPSHTLPPPPPTHVIVSYSPAPVAQEIVAPVVVPRPTPRLTTAGWLFISWITFSAGLLFVVLSRWLQVARRIRSTTEAPPSINAALVSVRRMAHFKPSVRVRLTENAMSPAVCGLWSPVILLPRALTEQLSATGLRAVLLHELFHLKRRDIWVNCLQLMLQITYWWNPLLWLANARIRQLREESVDDSVMVALQDEGPNYAPTLLEVARLALARPMLSLGLVGIIESRSALRHRIERLVNFTAPRRSGLSIVSIIGIAALTAAAVPMAEAPPKQAAAANKVPLEIRSENALFNTATGLTTFSNDVVVKGSNLLLTADNVIVDRKAESITASGHVNLAQGPSVQKGDQVVIDRTNDSRIVMTNHERRVLMEKVYQIRIDEVSFHDKPLSEVVVELIDKIQKADPTHGGIPIRIQSQSEATAGTIDPQTGKPVATKSAADPVNIESIRITIDPPLVNARLADVLHAIEAAAPKIKYSILDNAVAFSPKGDPQEPFHIRKFTVDNQRFASAIGLDPINPSTNMAVRFTAISNFVGRAGVSLDPLTGRNIFWSPAGDFLVRAKPTELDIIENALASSGVVIPGDPGQSPPAKFHASELVQDGKLLFESGKLDEAEVKFKQAAELDPQNQAAVYYLSQIQRVRENKPTTILKTNSASLQPNSNQASNSYIIRGFKLDENTFTMHLKEEGLLDSNFSLTAPAGDLSKVRDLAHTALISKFAKAGVDFRPETGKRIFWNDRTSTLLVRAPASDLDAIEPVLWELNTSPPQIQIKAKVIELPEKLANQIWARWAPTNVAGAEPWSGVLSPTQAKDLSKELESMGSAANLLNQPSVTTLSKRQAQIQLVDTQWIFTGVSNGLPIAQQYPLGMTLDLIPSIASDNESIQLTVSPTFIEFLGYEDSKGRLPKKNQTNLPIPPIPHFRVREIKINTTLADGSTLMLGRPSVKNMVVRNQEPQSEPVPENSQHNLLVLVTPTLITASGVRMHPDQ